jgi:hypothetical protein
MDLGFKKFTTKIYFTANQGKTIVKKKISSSTTGHKAREEW